MKFGLIVAILMFLPISGECASPCDTTESVVVHRLKIVPDAGKKTFKIVCTSNPGSLAKDLEVERGEIVEFTQDLDDRITIRFKHGGIFGNEKKNYKYELSRDETVRFIVATRAKNGKNDYYYYYVAGYNSARSGPRIKVEPK